MRRTNGHKGSRGKSARGGDDGGQLAMVVELPTAQERVKCGAPLPRNEGDCSRISHPV